MIIRKRDSLLKEGASPLVLALRAAAVAALTFTAVTLFVALAALVTAD